MRSLSDTGRSSKAFSRNILRLVGPIEVIWIAIWGFAFAKAIRKYGRSRGFIGEPQPRPCNHPLGIEASIL